MERKSSTRDVAAAMGVTASTVQAWARAGLIPFSTTPGGHRRFDLGEVLEAVEPTTSRLAPMARSRIGTGEPVARSSQMEARSRMLALRGEDLSEAANPADQRRSALIGFIERSSRVDFHLLSNV